MKRHAAEETQLSVRVRELTNASEIEKRETLNHSQWHGGRSLSHFLEEADETRRYAFRNWVLEYAESEEGESWSVGSSMQLYSSDAALCLADRGRSGSGSGSESCTHTIARLHGFASLFTEPRQRGKGFASLLLQKYMEQVAKSLRDPLHIGFLFTDVGYPIYEKCGFQRVLADIRDVEFTPKLLLLLRQRPANNETDVDLDACGISRLFADTDAEVLASQCTRWSLELRNSLMEEAERSNKETVLVDPIVGKWGDALSTSLVEILVTRHCGSPRPSCTGAQCGNTVMLWAANQLESVLQIMVVMWDPADHAEQIAQDMESLVRFGRHVAAAAGLTVFKSWMSNVHVDLADRVWPVASQGGKIKIRENMLPMISLRREPAAGPLHCPYLSKLSYY
eukprot:ANDGO_08322.mRNA.1 hypothetical protein